MRDACLCLTKSFWKEMWNPDGAILPTKRVCSSKARAEYKGTYVMRSWVCYHAFQMNSS